MGCYHDLAGKCCKLDLAQLGAGGEQGAMLQAVAAKQLTKTPDSIFFVVSPESLDTSGVGVMLQLLGARSRSRSRRAHLSLWDNMLCAHYTLQLAVSHLNDWGLQMLLLDARAYAGEQGQLNQPGCDVLTSGAVALLLTPSGEEHAVTELERQLADAMGAASAAAVTRRVSQTTLHMKFALEGRNRVTKRQKASADAAKQQSQGQGASHAADTQADSGAASDADEPAAPKTPARSDDLDGSGPQGDGGAAEAAGTVPVIEPEEIKQRVAEQAQLLRERKEREARELAATAAAAEAAVAQERKTSQDEAADVRDWARDEAHGTAVQPDDGGLPAGEGAGVGADAGSSGDSAKARDEL